MNLLFLPFRVNTNNRNNVRKCQTNNVQPPQLQVVRRGWLCRGIEQLNLVRKVKTIDCSGISGVYSDGHGFRAELHN